MCDCVKVKAVSGSRWHTRKYVLDGNFALQQGYVMWCKCMRGEGMGLGCWGGVSVP